VEHEGIFLFEAKASSSSLYFSEKFLTGKMVKEEMRNLS
jgi:hypothetical protein